ncbi:TetR family transcriptional regulator [Pseudonocardia acaciae]|uniref:TetR family transcriptional regulator n=1 Tax=Pseudonocardia acaciae TaxID=551276 RepID=UPI0006856139|nr:TetR family transcriptional regulator [Pseudonocardia acaciae]
MRRTAEETAATRAAVLDAALFVFAERGYASATLADVAGRAGVTRGAVYHHFADKSALLAAVLGEPWDAVAGPAWAELDGPGVRGLPLRERLPAFAAAWLGALREDARFQALMAVGMDAGGRDPAPGAKAHALVEWRDRLATTFRAARAELADGVTPEAAAAHLLAWLCGTAMLAGADPSLIGPASATAAFRGLLR